MNKHFREIEDLFSGYFSGDLSENERVLVDQWRRESSENEKIFKVASAAWGSVLMLDEMEKYNSFGALKAVNSRLPVSRPTRWWLYFQRLAAIVLLPLLIYAAYVEINNRKLSKNHAREALWQSVSTKRNMVSQFVLPDSTKVWLNSGSNLQFPYAFTNGKREVRLTGEAYFKVTVNKKSPFVIHADQLEITVLGTTLNVISHAGQASEVVLISGKVNLAVNNGKESRAIGELKPGQRAIYNNKTEIIQFERVDMEKYTSWWNKAIN